MRPRITPAHPIHDLLLRRWSPRAFADRPIEPEKLATLFEAARWAPSSFNEQPWSFIVATKDYPDDYARLLSCLAEKNQQWARSAPVLAISVAALSFKHNAKANRHHFHDVGLATGMLLVQATSLDIYAHMMAGFSPDAARQTFAIPATHEPVAALVLGYLGDPATLPPDIQQRELTPSTRKPLRDFVFSSRWGNPAPWTSA
jgi:nitroreductase